MYLLKRDKNYSVGGKRAAAAAVQCNLCIPNYSMLSNILQKGESVMYVQYQFIS